MTVPSTAPDSSSQDTGVNSQGLQPAPLQTNNGQVVPDAASRPAGGQALPAGQEQGSEASRGQQSPTVVPVDWIRQAIRPRVEDSQAQSPEPEKPVEEADPKAGTTTPDPATTVTEPVTAQGNKPLTQAEQDSLIERRVQAEVDRREARRNQDADRRMMNELRDKDPYAYAQEVRRREEAAQSAATIPKQAVDFANEQITTFDRKVLDPLVVQVEDSEAKARILSSAPAGMEGREYIAKEMLSLLTKQAETRGMATARQTLANDPAFIKEILVRHGGQRADPEVVSAVGAAPRRAADPDSQMNGFLRNGRPGR